MPSLLSINNYYYLRGGAETVFFSHNKLFEEMGWQVIPFAMHHPKNFSTPWSKYFVEEIEIGSEYTFIEKVIRVPKTIYSFESRSKVRDILANNEIDVCHIHNIYHHISPSVLSLLKKRGIPIVLTMHDLKVACPAYSMLNAGGVCERCKGGKIHNVLRHRCIKNSALLSAVVLAEAALHRTLRTYDKYVDKFVVPSQFYIEKMVEWGWDRERFVHIPNFVETSAFRPDFTPGKAFLYFGRLSREKGLVTLIKACSKANVPLRIVGSGPDEIKLREVSEEVGANVQFLGYLSGDVLHEAIRTARAVILPSEWYENAPLSVLESYALGKPIIAASIGGIPELVRDGETGFTYESASIEGLASVLSSVYTKSDEALSDMGRAGRLWMEQDFSLDNYRARILSLYDEECLLPG